MVQRRGWHSEDGGLGRALLSSPATLCFKARTVYASSNTDDGGCDVKERYVNASDISTYVFCQKAWQLSQIGAPSQNTSEPGKGIEWQAAHSEQVAGAERSGRLARVFAFAVLVLLLALAFRFFAP
jgi:hypothetical protein